MADIELVADQPVEEIVNLARVAEEEDFEGVWVTDHYNNRNPFVALTAVAGATERVSIGPGITNPYYAHPAYTANAIATLDEYSDGRARLGIGPGDPNTLAALEIERESPLYEVLDAVKLTRALLGGDKVTVEGLAKDAKLNYETRVVPIYVGAQGPNMLRMASDHGDGILINASHPDDFEWSLEQIGETDAEIVAYTSFSVSEDRESAKKVARQPVAFIASASPPPVLERHGIDAELAEEIGEHVERGEFSEAFAKVSDAMLDAFSVWGTPDECAERVEELYETGVDTVVVGSPLGPEPADAIRVASEIV
ncbi:MAG: 5,10-methylenetetrahydromethanopterin reductase [Halobacteriales archaeon]|nr:5,10-methylenetetrahydromethanopterin reductase [Halobacteriales archaeon]